MTAHTEILKMIETVNPADTAKLDEIDVEVGDYIVGKWCGRQFTRSRDALKSIRPLGWNFAILPLSDFTVICRASYGDPARIDGPDTPHLQTEELAELHAIIQAVAHDRAGKEGRG